MRVGDLIKGACS